MTYTELQNRKERLIEYIRNEVYNEEQLAEFEALVLELEGGGSSANFPEGYPFAPSKEKLTDIIEEVLEQDRQGLFYTTEELMERLGVSWE